MPRQKKRFKAKRNPRTTSVPAAPRPVPATNMVLPWVSTLLLLGLAFSLSLQPAIRMGRLWMGQDGFQRYKLEFNVNGVPAEWGYACWAGPLTVPLSQFGQPGEGVFNDSRSIPPAVDHNIDGGALDINGTPFSNGIGVHAPSKIAFAPQGKSSRFSCLVGLDVKGNQSLGVIYSLVADGHEIFKSPKLKSDADPFPINVSLSGVKELVLCADITEFGDIDSDVDWVNLKFEQ
jgi:hypothetical protein